MITSIKIDGVELEENICIIINKAVLEYRKNNSAAEEYNVQATFETIKEKEEIFY